METVAAPKKSVPDVVPAQVTLRGAAERIGINRHYLKGYAEAIGVRFVPIGRALVMSRRDFERIRERLANRDGVVVVGR